ncbi:hypothetical protein [Halobacillus sp. Marseille-P3879]|uniref:hypothetical protein n=1 Tax=Halobacillus sp. Marseille-P3879 TaxID=2045014 RepID=UPI00135836CD|nr:hypothetical protein [Halobacillus sp. Marseille-P3879]
MEKGFQIEVFDNRRPNEQEMEEGGAPYTLGEKGRKNYYIWFHIFEDEINHTGQTRL